MSECCPPGVLEALDDRIRELELIAVESRARWEEAIELRNRLTTPPRRKPGPRPRLTVAPPPADTETSNG